MKRCFTVSFFLLFLFPIGLFAQPHTSLNSQQNEWLSKSYTFHKAGWIYLHIEGTPEERGFQHGYLLAPQIKEALWELRERWDYLSAMDWNYFVHAADSILAPRVDKENLAEIDGIVEGMTASGDTVTRNEIIGLNGYMEIIDYWWPKVADSLRISTPKPKQESCSSFIATGSMTADGKIVLGHNTMQGFEEPFCNIIIDIKPDSGYRMLMQTYPGFIHSGTDFFITSAGLVGSETTIGSFSGFDAKEVPEFSRMRQASQYAGSIEQWCKIMEKGNNGGYANAWLLGDINTNQIARLELGLKYQKFEIKKDGYFVGSNVAKNLKILRFETTEEETNIKFSSVARDVRWHQLMKEYAGKIDITSAEKFEADDYDTYLGKIHPDQRTLCGHSELDSRMDGGPGDPFSPWGTLDGKVVNAEMAKNMSFYARWGSADGMPFSAEKFQTEHPQFGWMAKLMKDRPTEPWAEFTSGEKPAVKVKVMGSN